MVLSRALPLLLAACGLPALAWAGATADKPEHRPETQKPLTSAQVGAYVVRATNGENLALDPPVLPDLSGYTAEAIAQKVPRGPKGSATIRRMVEVETLHEFVGGTGRLSEWAARQSTNPEVIVIEGGVMTPKDLLKALSPTQFAEVQPGVYVLRLPLMIANGSAFDVNADTKELRLSQDRGTFISNDGLLFLRGTRLTGWNEQAARPALFKDAREFRPFLVSWGGSKLFIEGSAVSSLGYSAPKAYGVSISQYSPHTDARLHRARPTGWLLNSTFSDIWFGFYCYEADDVVIAGNTYKDNIVYNVDPHDRSRRLIIADNTITGARIKHGLIISREVNDSWIFNNRISGNKLSGIVIDRNSTNNVIAGNELTRNGTDGLTIYESAKNLLWANKSIGNTRHGFRLRNSTDIRLYKNIAMANRLSGIYGHIKDLTGTDRDLRLDPFSAESSVVVVGGQLVFNGSGPVTLDRPLSAELYNVDLLAPSKKVGIQMTGILGNFQEQILDILVRQRAAAVIEPAAKKSAPGMPAAISPASAPATPAPPAGRPPKPSGPAAAAAAAAAAPKSVVSEDRPQSGPMSTTPLPVPSAGEAKESDDSDPADFDDPDTPPDGNGEGL